MNCDLTVTWFNSRLIVFIDESVVPAVCCFVDHRLSLSLSLCVCVFVCVGWEERDVQMIKLTDLFLLFLNLHYVCVNSLFLTHTHMRASIILDMIQYVNVFFIMVFNDFHRRVMIFDFIPLQ